MIVLAATPQEKGKQLEALTMKLLHHRGYQNCTTNVMANGAEIDVRGELPIPGLGSIRSLKLICECKAHKAAMDMTQWCKFLGKVFHQEVCSQTEVAGCFISLSGVNGHVQGNYDEFFAHRKSVTLLHGDELLKLVSEIIAFVSLKRISQIISTVTDRTASRFEPAYHDGEVYWIIIFSGGDFTIRSAVGLPVDSTKSNSLASMVQTELDLSSYIDIEQEAQAKHRAAMSKVLVVATLFSAGGKLDSFDSLAQIGDFSPEELKVSAEALVKEGHLQSTSKNELVVPVSTTEEGELVSLDLYRILFAARFPNNVLQADFYQRHINKAFLSEICKVQAGLPLDPDESNELIELLRLSPTAVFRSLYPIQMIVFGRENEGANEYADRFHKDYFRQMVLEALKRDFHTSELSEFYHEHKVLRELELRSKLVLKSDKQIVHEAEFTERIGIVRADASIGGGLYHVAMLKDSPQPWDPPSAWTIPSQATNDSRPNEGADEQSTGQ